MLATILWGDDQVAVLQRDWIRHATRLPYRKTYRLKAGQRWHDAPTTAAQWEHYVEFDDDIIPVGAAIARELLAEGAVSVLWTECWGRRPVFMSPILFAVQPAGELAEVLQQLYVANGRRWGGLPDVVALFPDGRIAMREAKVRGKDRLSKTQHSFARGCSCAAWRQA
ncbi:MAG TPA: hypothetical protein VM940_00325 [Chthoniobacterales bacterium]|jgi:hypothetical protein|nr:hypothetical protein [Chthoniobacterales bacterium]